MIEAELPDGRILEFPDGTNPAVIQRTVKNVLGVKEASTMDGINQRMNEAGTGVVQGVAGLAGLPQTANELIGRGVNAAANLGRRLTGNPEKEFTPRPLPGFPSAEQAQEAIYAAGQTVDPNFKPVEPTDRLGRVLQTTGRVMGSAPFPGMGIPNLGAAAGENIAGEALRGTPMEGPGRAVGGLAGGLIASVPGMIRSTPGEMVARRTQDMTPDDWARAEAAQAQANRQGVPLLAAEAMDNPAMSRLAADTQASAGGGARMERFLAQRPEQVRTAVGSMLDDLAKADLPENVVRRVQEAATGVIRQAEQARTQAASPFYKMAEGTTLPPDSIQFLTNTLDDLSRNAPQAVGSKLQGLKARLLGNPSIGAVSGEAKLLRESTNTAAINVPLDEKMAGAKARPFVSAAETEMEAVSPAYATGQQIFRQMSPRVDELKSGDIGRMASPDPDVVARVGSKLGAQIETVLNPATARPETIRKISMELKAQDPEAIRDLARVYLENSFNDATKRIQAGENRMLGANFVKQVAGTDQQRANLKTFIEEAAKANGQKPDGVWLGWNNLLETLERTGKVPGIGSPTTARSESFAEAGQGVVSGALQVDISRPLNLIGRWYRDMFQRGNFRELAEIMTSPDGVKIMKQMAVTKPNTAKAKALAVSFAGLARSNSEQQLEQPDNE